MNNKQFKKIIIIVLVIGIAIFLPITSVFAVDKLKNPEVKSQSKTEAKTPSKEKKEEKKSVECFNCPNNCLIKPNKTGKCGKYKNINGKLVPTKK